ncbi:MAG TPA: hypothetical protein VIF62_23555 [Labilithrix sp.]|jgi:hypothetical protein
MAKHTPEKHLVPFALAPSARPPASGVHHAQVRVPAPPHVELTLPLSSAPSSPEIEVDAIEDETDESGEREIARPPPSRPGTLLPPPQVVATADAIVQPVPRAKFVAPTVRIKPASTPRATRPIVFAAVGAILAIAIAFGVTVLVLRSPAPAPRAATFTDDNVPSAAPSAAPSASVVAPAPKPFNRDAARASLDALAPKVSECKTPRGKAVRAKITFAPTGEATSVTMLAPATGKGAACVASRLRDATVDAFDGAPTSYVHTFAR